LARSISAEAGLRQEQGDNRAVIDVEVSGKHKINARAVDRVEEWKPELSA
jgi:hypothetical protein